MIFLCALLAGAGAAGYSLSFPPTASAAGPVQPGTYGYDISFPQCPSRVPSGNFSFAIVGVNNGRAMTENPCMPAQLAWARSGTADPAVYINTNSPPATFRSARCQTSDRVCLSYEYGREAAAYAIAYVQRHATDVQRYWLDVETLNTWSTSTQENAAVLRGMIATLSVSGKSVGIYSTSYQFRLIAGNFAPGLDNWVPRPEAKRDTVASFCRTTPSFGGGRVVMIQMWYTFDENYACAADNSPPPTPVTFKQGDVAQVATSGCLNLRDGTGVNFPVLECLNEGARVTVTGTSTPTGAYTWVPLVSPSGKSGWAAAEYLQLVADPPQNPPQRPHRIFISNLAGD